MANVSSMIAAGYDSIFRAINRNARRTKRPHFHGSHVTMPQQPGIDVLIGHADIAGPDWIKDVLGTARQTIVDLREPAAREAAPRQP